MKYSIRKQMMAIFLGLMCLIIALVFCMNGAFLETYYVSHKETDMKLLYSKLEKVIDNGKIDEEDTKNEIMRECNRTNISVSVMNSDNGNVLFFTEQSKKGPLFSQLIGYLISLNKGEELHADEKYHIYKIKSPTEQGEYLEMYGTLEDNIVFVMQTPIESIRDSVVLSNRFLIYVGIITLFLGGIFVWFFSKRLTDPIQELTELSQQMADLEFEAKYSGGGKNEIGILGENFNKMSRQLEETITELKRANQQLQRDIEQKEKIENMRNEFLGNVSHELKTPIALIQGYAEGLKEGISDDPESQAFYCEVIMDEADKMNQMVKNLLVLNQLEFGSVTDSWERFNIVSLIKGVLSSCEILIEQVEAKIDLIADEEVYVWADEWKAEHVFRNYFTNALNHLKNEKRIEIRVVKETDVARISVFNSGQPIPEEELDKIWDKFYKVDKAHTREYGGNGIGLSIVKAIMDSFHQKYGVKNFENGVEFWFELDAKNLAESNKIE